MKKDILIWILVIYSTVVSIWTMYVHYMDDVYVIRNSVSRQVELSLKKTEENNAGNRARLKQHSGAYRGACRDPRYPR